MPRQGLRRVPGRPFPDQDGVSASIRIAEVPHLRVSVGAARRHRPAVRSAPEDLLSQSASVVDEADLVDTEDDIGGSAGDHGEVEVDGGIAGEGGEEAEGEEDVGDGGGDGNGGEDGMGENCS